MLSLDSPRRCRTWRGSAKELGPIYWLDMMVLAPLSSSPAADSLT